MYVYDNFLISHSQGCGIDVHKDMVVANINGEGLQVTPPCCKALKSPFTDS